MPKTKRRKKQEAQEADAPRLKCRVKTWVTADGANKGFGFLDCFEEGAACSGIFVHKSEIGDGSALVVGSEVTVGALHADLKKPGAFRAVRVAPEHAVLGQRKLRHRRAHGASVPLHLRRSAQPHSRPLPHARPRGRLQRGGLLPVAQGPQVPSLAARP